VSRSRTFAGAGAHSFPFRGFTARPVAGTSQGLAVYVNGACFNDAFGDTVNRDLIPPAAIESVRQRLAEGLSAF
jgi:hypothetical protein